MYDCPRCGMLPDACVCIPWCYRHDMARPCESCVTDPEPPSKAWVAPVVFLGIVLLTVLIYLVGKG